MQNPGQIVISPQEIEQRVADRGLHFETESERQEFGNELFNSETISRFIESSFNGNVLYMGAMD